MIAVERDRRLWWRGLGGRSFGCGSQRCEPSLRMTGCVGGWARSRFPSGLERKKGNGKSQYGGLSTATQKACPSTSLRIEMTGVVGEGVRRGYGDAEATIEAMDGATEGADSPRE